MKLPKIPKNTEIEALRITEKQIRANVRSTIDGVIFHGSTFIEEEVIMSAYQYPSLADEQLRLKRIAIHGGLLPFAKDIDSFHLRKRHGIETMIVRFKNGGCLELDDRYPDIAWDTETVKAEVTA